MSEDSFAEFRIRRALAYAFDLYLLGFGEIIDAILDITKDIKRSLNPIDKVSFFESVIHEPYEIFVKPLRTHLCGLDFKPLTQQRRIILSALSPLIKTFHIERVLLPYVVDKMSYDLLAKCCECADYESLGKRIYDIWSRIYQKGEVSRYDLEGLTEAIKLYAELCKDKAQQLRQRVRMRIRAIKIICYTIEYAPLLLSIEGLLTSSLTPINVAKAIVESAVSTTVVKFLERKIVKDRTEDEIIRETLRKARRATISQLLSLSTVP